MKFAAILFAPLFTLLLATTALRAEPVGSLLAVKASKAPKSSDARLDQMLDQHRGQAAIVNFWASWCEPCREEMPALGRLGQRLKADGLTVLTVAVADNAKRVDDLLWELDVTLPFIDDREQVISRAWGARMLPTSVVLDRRHRVVYRAQGVVNWDSPQIETKLRALLN